MVDRLTSPSTESSFRVTVSVNKGKSSEWEMVSGGGRSSSTSKVRIGTQPEKTVTLPSVSDSADVTLTRHMVIKDVWELQRQLLNLVGSGLVDMWMHPLDGNGVPFDVNQLTYSAGLIVAVSPVQVSNESTSVASITMTVSGGRWT